MTVNTQTDARERTHTHSQQNAPGFSHHPWGHHRHRVARRPVHRHTRPVRRRSGVQSLDLCLRCARVEARDVQSLLAWCLALRVARSGSRCGVTPPSRATHEMAWLATHARSSQPRRHTSTQPTDSGVGVLKRLNIPTSLPSPSVRPRPAARRAAAAFAHSSSSAPSALATMRESASVRAHSWMESCGLK